MNEHQAVNTLNQSQQNAYCSRCWNTDCKCAKIPPVIAKTFADTEGTYASLPTTAPERKALPICTGVLDYFPDALAAVAACSKAGNDQHHPGTPLHWDMNKSTDEADSLVRHLIQRGTLDTDGVRHTAKVAWRALALLQREILAERK